MQFLIAFLQGNPFAAKLSLKELMDNLEKETTKLKEMMPVISTDESEEVLPLIVPEMPSSKWEYIESELLKVISKMEEEENEEFESENSSIGEENLLTDILQKIKTHLENKEYQRAIQLMMAAKEAWPDANVFQSLTNEENDSEEPLSVSETEKKVKVLKAIFVGGQEDVQSSNAMEMNMDEFQKVFHLDEGATNISQLEIVNDISKQQILVKYLQDCVQFAQQLQKALPMVAQLLSSKSVTDIMEAVEFFVTAFEFGVQESIFGIRKMLPHVWSNETVVKDAVVAAYRRLYLNSKRGGQRVKAAEVINNLSTLIHGATVGELNSIEKLIGEFVKCGDFSSAIFQVLWERFSTFQGASCEQSHAALVLLGMAGGVETDIIISNLDLLVSVGLGPRAKDEPLLAKETCTALLKLAGCTKPSIESKDAPLRYPQDHIIFTRLSDIVVDGFCQISHPFWIPLAEQAVSVIYKLAEHPDFIVGEIIKKLARDFINFCGVTEAQDQELNVTCPSQLLTRLVHLIGQTCLTQLVHLDVHVFTELKRRHVFQEKKEERDKKKKKRRSALIVPAKPQDDMTESTMDVEMGLRGVADDAEAEFIAKICETEMLASEQMLGIFSPMIVTICSNPAKYCSTGLRCAAALALAKIMLVNSTFCEAQLPLLITIMERSVEPVIRSNTIILLGDMSYRFPNLIEPWTPHLYARLRDPSIQVRKNTLSVLSHLILNDMIKVKGQISDIALCLVDKEECICGLAKMFFRELSKKGNAVYNILPDIISRLSDPECGTEEDNFRTVLKYLLSFIDKDRQLECLVEKLCQRFNSTRAERQNRDIAFCLSLLPFNERCLRKLQENISCYAEKLKEAEVYHHFVGILSAAKKSTNFKPESKLMVEELERMMADYHTKGVTDENVALMSKKALAASQTPARRRTVKTLANRHANRYSCRKRKVGAGNTQDRSDTDEEFQTSIQVSIKKRPTLMKPKRSESQRNGPTPQKSTVRKGKYPALVFSSDSEQETSDIENENPIVESRTRSGRLRN